MKSFSWWLDLLFTSVLISLVLLYMWLMPGCAAVHENGNTVIEYEFKGVPVTREQLQKIDDRAWKRLQRSDE